MAMNRGFVPVLFIHITSSYILARRSTLMLKYASIFRVIYISHYSKLTSHKTLRYLSNILLHFGNKLDFITFLVVKFPFTLPIPYEDSARRRHLPGTAVWNLTAFKETYSLFSTRKDKIQDAIYKTFPKEGTRRAEGSV
jgi:hypothetical protein